MHEEIIHELEAVHYQYIKDHIWGNQTSTFDLQFQHFTDMFFTDFDILFSHSRAFLRGISIIAQ